MKLKTCALTSLIFVSNSVIASARSVSCTAKFGGGVPIHYVQNDDKVTFILQASILQDHAYASRSVDQTARDLGLENRFDLRSVELTFPAKLCSSKKNDGISLVACSLSAVPEPDSAILQLKTHSGKTFVSVIYRLHFGAQASLAITQDTRISADDLNSVGQGFSLEVGTSFDNGTSSARIPFAAKANEIASLDCKED
ncbi:MAG: hypothetical protein NTV34_11720 [Proteobacteria bacterium]|nr:hypothetical protein [Pseudomonadota bacterium]